MPIPPDAIQKGNSGTFTEANIPAALLNEHSLAANRWGILHLLAGQVTFVNLSTNEETLLEAPAEWIIEPEVPHKLTLAGSLEIRIDFYRRTAE